MASHVSVTKFLAQSFIKPVHGSNESMPSLGKGESCGSTGALLPSRAYVFHLLWAPSIALASWFLQNGYKVD